MVCTDMSLCSTAYLHAASYLEVAVAFFSDFSNLHPHLQHTIGISFSPYQSRQIEQKF